MSKAAQLIDARVQALLQFFVTPRSTPRSRPSRRPAFLVAQQPDSDPTQPGQPLLVSVPQSAVGLEGCAPAVLLRQSPASMRGAAEGSATAPVHPSGYDPGDCPRRGTGVRLHHGARYHSRHPSAQNHPPPTARPWQRKRFPPAYCRWMQNWQASDTTRSSTSMVIWAPVFAHCNFSRRWTRAFRFICFAPPSVPAPTHALRCLRSRWPWRRG